MRAKRISKGHYEYRGFEIICLGYYNPEHKVVWECVDKNGHGFGQDFSLKNCKFYVPGAHYDCHETIEEAVTDKAHRNFCDFFSPKIILICL